MSAARALVRLCAPAESRTELVLVMHPAEVGKASCTGWLLSFMLPAARTLVYQGRDKPLETPRPTGGSGPPPRELVLHPAGRLLSQQDAAGPCRLWVPDGSWRQTRRMMQRVEQLRQAEPVSVGGDFEPPLAMRRPPKPGHVSTGEAVARALGILEGAAIEQQLRAGLSVVVERTLQLRREGKRGGGRIVTSKL